MFFENFYKHLLLVCVCVYWIFVCEQQMFGHHSLSTWTLNDTTLTVANNSGRWTSFETTLDIRTHCSKSKWNVAHLTGTRKCITNQSEHERKKSTAEKSLPILLLIYDPVHYNIILKWILWLKQIPEKWNVCRFKCSFFSNNFIQAISRIYFSLRLLTTLRVWVLDFWNKIKPEKYMVCTFFVSPWRPITNFNHDYN